MWHFIPFLSCPYVLKFVDGDATGMCSSYKMQHILYFDKQGHKQPTICRLMRGDGSVTCTSRVEIYELYELSLDVALLWARHFDAAQSRRLFLVVVDTCF